MTPTDDDAFVGEPPLGCPVYDEVHISVCFTWDISRAEYLASQWVGYAKEVRIGGPAVSGSNGDFVPGSYLRQGVTITSRGCPNNCWFCLVPKRNDELQELPIRPGRIIQDDNLLACSPKHIKSVFTMLKSQKAIEFSGGLEASRVTSRLAEKLSELRILQIWLSYDTPEDEEPLRQAIKNLKPFFKRKKIRCYVLIAFPGDTLHKAEHRLKRAWRMGTLPFAMRYRKPALKFNESFVYRERAWNLLTRQWTRPAIIKSIMAKV